MPEWLSQLGIGVSSSAAMSKPSANSNDASNSNAANKSINSPIRTKSTAAVTSKSGKLAAKISSDQSTFTKNGQNSVVKKNSYPALTPLLENTMISGVDYVNESYMFPVDYHFHTLNGGVPPANAATATAGLAQPELAAIIPLENADGGNKCDVDSFAWDWTLDSSLWNTINGEYANDTLVVQHFGPLKNLLNCCQHPGKGHNFQSMSMAHPTWCDKCGDFMWGFLTTAVKCDSCNYTCHARCRALVTLDCKTVDSSLKHSPEEAAAVATDVLESATDSAVAITAPVVNLYPDIRLMALRDSDMSSAEHTTKPTVLEAVMKTTTTTTVEEEEGHEKENDMTTGSVQIHMNFTRPINVVAGQTPPSFVDIVNGSDTATANTIRTITTFFLPRNTVKTVNISSRMTTREMIVILLRKFRVADNPRKFALYEYTATSTNAVAAGDCDNSGGADYTCDNYRYNFQRVPDDAYPLRVVNEWKRNATNGQHKHLVLQENDTGDILWDMFEVPELENFLKILDDEERQYSFRIRQKYDTYRFYLVETLRKRGHFDENEDCSTGEHGITMTTHHSIDNVKNNPSFEEREKCSC